MSESYCLVLKFYKNDELICSKFIEARDLRDISENFDVSSYDKLVISGYYFETNLEDCESDDSMTIDFMC